MRLTLVATFALAISSQAHANIEQQLANCASHTDKLDRLMCYDALAASVKSPVPTQLPAASAASASAPAVVAPVAATTAVTTTTNAAAAAAATTTSPQTASSVEQEFGLKKVSAEEDELRLYAEVSSVKKDPYGSLIVTLSNNQTWKQVGTERYKLKVGYKVYIEKGALSSYLLGTDDRNSTMRVKRLN
ncbi:hypothetical protein [Shewanella sp. KT0246]|uniref:hypothetical protein n=1 Tax=Shewanella sp. KT0246 TaxID=2815912 RepID=UPI001BC40563|nr:hypothetical protein [Shewanella sp. KT0246]GIU52003.1 hypothetical protein TUM4249_19540 [Shewanella sp. KT0246]